MIRDDFAAPPAPLPGFPGREETEATTLEMARAVRAPGDDDHASVPKKMGLSIVMGVSHQWSIWD